jgi:hypothetical protein
LANLSNRKKVELQRAVVLTTREDPVFVSLVSEGRRKQSWLTQALTPRPAIAELSLSGGVLAFHALGLGSITTKQNNNNNKKTNKVTKFKFP